MSRKEDYRGRWDEGRPEVAADAELGFQHALPALMQQRQEVQRDHARARRQKAAPEDAQAGNRGLSHWTRSSGLSAALRRPCTSPITARQILPKVGTTDLLDYDSLDIQEGAGLV